MIIVKMIIVPGARSKMEKLRKLDFVVSQMKKEKITETKLVYSLQRKYVLSLNQF